MPLARDVHRAAACCLPRRELRCSCGNYNQSVSVLGGQLTASSDRGCVAHVTYSVSVLGMGRREARQIALPVHLIHMHAAVERRDVQIGL